jgi:hypothetical protein
VLNNEIGAKVSHWLLPRLHALSARRERRVCAGSFSLLAIVAAAMLVFIYLMRISSRAHISHSEGQGYAILIAARLNKGSGNFRPFVAWSSANLFVRS